MFLLGIVGALLTAPHYQYKSRCAKPKQRSFVKYGFTLFRRAGGGGGAAGGARSFYVPPVRC